MKERPILFSGPMVRAILYGTKTMTRRVVKQPLAEPLQERAFAPGCNILKGLDGSEVRCPYGVPGDRLYCKETWATGDKLDEYNATQIAEMAEDAGFEGRSPKCPLLYKDDSRVKWGPNDLQDFGPFGRWRSARFMPRWASRIDLGITDIRVERVQEISEGDAKAEGAQPCFWYTGAGRLQEEEHRNLAGPGLQSVFEGTPPTSWRNGFANFWDSINGKKPGRSWDDNPWCWCITFRRVKP